MCFYVEYIWFISSALLHITSIPAPYLLHAIEYGAITKKIWCRYGAGAAWIHLVFSCQPCLLTGMTQI